MLYILVTLGIIFALCFVIILEYKMIKFYKLCNEKEIDKVQKFIEFYDILVKWIQHKQKGKTFVSYIENNDFDSVAIYGMKEMGLLLFSELQNNDINVVCAIDKNAELLDCEIEIPVISNLENIPNVDVIIVTPIHYFDSIHKELRGFTKAEIVSIEDLIWSI